jgi:hypothetical protein
MLRNLSGDDPTVLERPMPTEYDELRKLANFYLRPEETSIGIRRGAATL